MDNMNNLSGRDNKYVQICRLFLKVQTLADVCNAEGNRMILEFLRGDQVRDSTLQWPTQEKPPQRSWKVWKRFLVSFTAGSNNFLSCENRIGR